MSKLPPDFQFSQRSLQDFVDCRRRFQLRYLLRLSWPAVEAKPMLEHEKHMQMGAEFHRLVQRHLSGVPAERLTTMLEADAQTDDALPRWWKNYLQYAGEFTAGFSSADGDLVEASLSAPLGAYRLVAKYDLVRTSRGSEDAKVTILDWKTSRQRPSRAWIAERLQTRVYPFLLVEAGDSFRELGSLEPGQVEMVYWYPEFPQEPVRIPYTAEQHQQDKSYLMELVREIENLAEDEFTLTEDEDQCRFCTYRSLCDRGVRAEFIDQQGFDSDEVQEDDFTFDFEDAAEIEF